MEQQFFNTTLPKIIDAVNKHTVTIDSLINKNNMNTLLIIGIYGLIIIYYGWKLIKLINKKFLWIEIRRKIEAKKNG